MQTHATGQPSSMRTHPDRATQPLNSGPRRSRPSFGDYHPDDLVPRKEAAALICVSHRTMEDWARDGTGPVFHKLTPGRSGRILYRVSDLLDWLGTRRRTSTTQDPRAAS